MILCFIIYSLFNINIVQYNEDPFFVNYTVYYLLRSALWVS